jgi:hypothetical protein
VAGLDLDQKGLPAQLKQAAFLKLSSKTSLKPAQVELLPQEGDLTTVVFLFPRTVEIKPEDKNVQFFGVFGRLSVTQAFSPKEMQFQGKLEL